MPQYLVARLKEPSTWRGAALLATALGISISPEQLNAIVAFGTATAGLIGVFSPDKPK